MHHSFWVYFEKWQSQHADFQKLNPFSEGEKTWMFSPFEDMLEHNYAKAHVTVDDNVAIGDVIGFEFDSGHNGKESYEAFVGEIRALPGIGNLVPVWVRAPKEEPRTSIHILSSFKKA